MSSEVVFLLDVDNTMLAASAAAPANQEKS